MSRAADQAMRFNARQGIEITPDHDLESDYGLVSPEGVFWSCDFYGHSRLGHKDEVNAYDGFGRLKPGWIHVRRKDWEMEAWREPTQRQLDTAFNWSLFGVERRVPEITRYY